MATNLGGSYNARYLPQWPKLPKLEAAANSVISNMSQTSVLRVHR